MARRVDGALGGSARRLGCASEQAHGLSDRILRDLVLRSAVDRRRTSDAIVLFYLAARVKSQGRTLKDHWRMVKPIVGEEAGQAAIALGAFGVDDDSTVQLVGQCLLRLRNVPGANRIAYPQPLVDALDAAGVAMPSAAKPGRNGYAGFALKPVYRTEALPSARSRRSREPGDVQPFPEFTIPDGVRDEASVAWRSCVAHPATNAAFTAAKIHANTPRRRRLFHLWLAAVERVIAVDEPSLSWRDATRALTVVLLREDPPDTADLGERIRALLEVGSGVNERSYPPDVCTAANSAEDRLTKAVLNWRRRVGFLPDSSSVQDEYGSKEQGPPPF